MRLWLSLSGNSAEVAGLLLSSRSLYVTTCFPPSPHLVFNDGEVKSLRIIIGGGRRWVLVIVGFIFL